MADQVYGLTRPAGALITRMADEFRQRLPDVGRRTRRNRDEGGSGLKVVYITEEAPAGGNGPFFTFTVAGDSPFICNDEMDGTGTDYEVNWNYENGVFFTGQRILIEKRAKADGSSGLWWEVAQAGEIVWPQATASGDIVAGAGFAEITYKRFYPTPAADQCIVSLVWFDSTFNVADLTDIMVTFDQSTGLFVGQPAACPPEV